MYLKKMLLLLVTILTGCSVFAPKYSMDHATVKDMIDKDFKEPLWISIVPDKKGAIINPFSREKAKVPLDALTQYCKKYGGILKQTSFNNSVPNNEEEIRSLTGSFECNGSVSGTSLWKADIEARKHLGGPYNKDPGYYFILRAR